MSDELVRGIVLDDVGDRIVVQATPRDTARFARNTPVDVSANYADWAMAMQRAGAVNADAMTSTAGPVPVADSVADFQMGEFQWRRAPIEPNIPVYDATGHRLGLAVSVDIASEPVEITAMGAGMRVFLTGRRRLRIIVEGLLP